MSNSALLNVTFFPADIIIEHAPDGICPFSQILALLKSPDAIAVQVVSGPSVTSSSV